VTGREALAPAGATPARRLLPSRPELRELLRLALPVVVVEVGLMFMGVVDTMSVGRIGAVAIAAVALGNLYYFAVSIFGMGLLLALDPIVAQAVGAGDDEGVARAMQRGLLLAALVAVATAILLVPADAALRALGQPSEVVPIAAGYAHASIPGTLPFFAFIVLRQSLQAIGRLRPIVGAIVGANIANAVLNWIFIHGRAGFPAMGAVGTGWASSVSRWLLVVLLVLFARAELRRRLVPLRREALDAAPLRRMIALGAPVGVHHMLEYGAFGVVTVLMGWLGATQVAAHQVALNLAALTFMVPLGVAAAGSVLVGRAIGRGDAPAARAAARTALVCGIAFMSTTALLFLGFAEALARLYTSDATVVALAASLIPLAGIFQVFDGTQVVSAGVLRGAGDTRAPMVIGLVGFWLVGIPISLLLGIHGDFGPRGLWWGLVGGLAAVAVILLGRVRHKFGRELRRVAIEGH
jgi:MATE family multidrug resistance protein